MFFKRIDSLLLEFNAPADYLTLLESVRTELGSIEIPAKYSKLEKLSQEMTDTCLNRIISRLFNQINSEFFGTFC
jgi:hypothetical protein